MKRWMGILALCLLLTGCSRPVPTPRETAAPTVQTGTDPVETAPEILRDLTLDGDYRAVTAWGDSLLLFGDGRVTRFRDGETVAARECTVPLPDSGMLRILEDTLVYVDPEETVLVTLDRDLTEVSRIPLNQTVRGDVYLAADGITVYYCDSAGISLWDAETRIHRSLKIHAGDWLGITGSLFDGEYLICQLQEADAVRALLIRADTGETVAENALLASMTGAGQRYVCAGDGEWILGQRDSHPRQLLVSDPVFTETLDMALTLEEEILTLYSLSTGLALAQEQAPELTEVSSPILWEGELLFLSGDRLWFWSWQDSPVEDDTEYTVVRYTEDDPDREGLAELQARAEELGAQYGVEILLWKAVEEYLPEGYCYSVEYRTDILTQTLDGLEDILAQFPDGFMSTAASWTEAGTLRLLLVREAETPEDVCGAAFLAGDGACILLRTEEEVADRFCHGLGHVIDTLVLSESKAFYEWDTLNPSGFSYDGSYDRWQDRESSYLQPGKNWFVSSYAMTFAAEDRACLLEYAMQAGNGELFQSKYMQAKLLRLKNGLREVFDLEGEAYPWEQYLN